MFYLDIERYLKVVSASDTLNAKERLSVLRVKGLCWTFETMIFDVSDQDFLGHIFCKRFLDRERISSANSSNLCYT